MRNEDWRMKNGEITNNKIPLLGGVSEGRGGSYDEWKMQNGKRQLLQTPLQHLTLLIG